MTIHVYREVHVAVHTVMLYVDGSISDVVSEVMQRLRPVDLIYVVCCVLA